MKSEREILRVSDDIVFEDDTVSATILMVVDGMIVSDGEIEKVGLFLEHDHDDVGD